MKKKIILVLAVFFLLIKIIFSQEQYLVPEVDVKQITDSVILKLKQEGVDTILTYYSGSDGCRAGNYLPADTNYLGYNEPVSYIFWKHKNKKMVQKIDEFAIYETRECYWDLALDFYLRFSKELSEEMLKKEKNQMFVQGKDTFYSMSVYGYDYKKFKVLLGGKEEKFFWDEKLLLENHFQADVEDKQKYLDNYLSKKYVWSTIIEKQVEWFEHERLWKPIFTIVKTREQIRKGRE